MVTSVGKLVLNLFVIVLFAGAARAQSTAPASSAFGPISINKLIIMPNSSGHVDWIDAIEGAQSSVHMTMYHLTDAKVIDALIAKAKDRSVDVRIIVDGKSLKGGYAKAIQKLTSAGVQVLGSSPAFSLTHSKDMVVDDQVAFIGAIDLTNTATTMRDFAITTSDPNIISEVESVFAADWDNAQNKTANTPAVSDPNLVWSPTNSTNQLVKLIDSATSTLVAETENFDNTDIADALNRAAQRGVQVRLITPECSYGNAALNYQGVAQLQGVSVHMEHDGQSIAQPYMHSKMMVVDGQTVYLGSINLSFNSIQNDRELGVIYTDAITGAQLSQEFETDWNRSQPPVSSANCSATN